MLCACVRARLAKIELTPRQFELVSVIALVALTLIVLSGAAVRLTGSGLGCPDWPRCFGHVYPKLQTHSLIEFGNRAVGGIVGVVTVAVAVLAWRRRPLRRDLAWLALALPLGVVAQAALGGVTVESKLAPGYVMAHFGLSMIILVAAATLVIFAGTAATAAGPHSGGATGQHIKRLMFDGQNTLNWTIHAHGAIAFTFGIAAVVVWVVLERRQANAQARRALSWLCGLIALQGVIGAVQYETHLPTELVWVHVLVASMTWLCVVWAIAAIGRPDPSRARKRAQIRASMLQRNS